MDFIVWNLSPYTVEFIRSISMLLSEQHTAVKKYLPPSTFKYFFAYLPKKHLDDSQDP